jgi:hypothetical protein
MVAGHVWLSKPGGEGPKAVLEWAAGEEAPRVRFVGGRKSDARLLSTTGLFRKDPVRPACLCMSCGSVAIAVEKEV